MKHNKYVIVLALVAMGIAISCSIDESKFPLPYNSRTNGAYLRMYNIPTTAFDLNDQANSGFEAVYEPVDEQNGDATASVDFFVSFRRGAALTQEVFVKNVSVAGFASVPAPTYSVYKRGSIRITMTETLAALAPIIGIDPDGPGPIAGAAPATGLEPYPGTTLAGDSFIFRMVQILKDGRRFTRLNAQQPVNPAFGNLAEDNGTPNITTGAFYGSPFTATMSVRSQFSQTAWTGTYTLQQRTNWSPAHTNAAGIGMHQTDYPAYMNEVNFPTQTVTIAVPAGGLPNEREFTVNYRGGTSTMRITLEAQSPGLNTTAVNNLVTNYGLSATGGTGSLGTVLVQLTNTGRNCSASRQFYWTTPTTGTFGGTALMAARFTTPPGLPGFTHANRGVFRTNSAGAVTGEVFTIGLDDDADEYGRRNGYCSWTRRVYLSLTKI